jgi:hypothetical protein
LPPTRPNVKFISCEECKGGEAAAKISFPFATFASVARHFEPPISAVLFNCANAAEMGDCPPDL